MQLSKRLQCIAEYVTAGKRIADIGCDHGWVSIYLAKNQISPFVIAMDVREGPLQRAKEHILSYGLERKIETRKSDGMAALQPGDVDSVVIAGMGGPLMIRILKQGKLVATKLDEMILSPQSELEQVRRFLSSTGWKITREEMVFDGGKYYTVMKVVHGKSELKTETDFCFGRIMIDRKDPILYQYLMKEKKTKEKILEMLNKQDTYSCKQRVKELKKELILLKEAVNRFEVKSEVNTYEV